MIVWCPAIIYICTHTHTNTSGIIWKPPSLVWKNIAIERGKVRAEGSLFNNIHLSFDSVRYSCHSLEKKVVRRRVSLFWHRIMATVELLCFSLSHNYTSPQLKRNLVKRKKKKRSRPTKNSLLTRMQNIWVPSLVHNSNNLSRIKMRLHGPHTILGL